MKEEIAKANEGEMEPRQRRKINHERSVLWKARANAIGSMKSFGVNERLTSSLWYSTT